MTTMGERWNRGDSKNHMILAQIEEWFHTGLAGIRAGDGSIAYRTLVIQPKLVGDLTFVEGQLPRRRTASSRSEWTEDTASFRLTVDVPPNTTAEVWVPTAGRSACWAPERAEFLRVDGDYAVYRVPSGSFVFAARDIDQGT